MARRTDHPSSKVAAREHVERGSAKSNRVAFLALVGKYPGLTSKQLGVLFFDLIGLAGARHEAGRRLPELREAGKVANVDPATGEIASGELRWWPVESVEVVQ